MSEVWKRFNGAGADLLLALAIADIAQDDGTKIFPSAQTLAKKTRQGLRTVKRQLAAFRASGWLQVERGLKGGRGVSVRYHIHKAWLSGQDMSPIRPNRKSVNLTRFPSKSVPTETLNRAIAVPERVPTGALNRAIAVARNPYDPSLSINIRARKTRASKAASDPKGLAALQEKVKILSGAGMAATDVVKTLSQYGVTSEQVDAWLAQSAQAKPIEAAA